ncbi:MAG: Gfo/Idh/MocA family oxidoreductase [Candidatus Omnitrophota bacterium]|nr:MAG: Gfo/Idh/MocA family oxidoreductase [Candidatus Omnitrophota bacterium]
MKKFKVGVIGLGVGEKHAEVYKSHPACKVVALCDFSEEKIKSIRPKYPSVKIVRDADEILFDKDINIVSIASYDNYHYEHVVKALNNEKHVFVEKPLCLYKEEGIKLRKLLKDKPHLKLLSNLILRKSPRFRLLKEMVQKGEFGDVYYIEGDYNYGRLYKLTNGWRGDVDFYSVVYGGGVHIVDLILWMTNDSVAEVFSYGNRMATKKTKFRHNDLCVSLLKFKSGMIGKVACNFGCVFPHFHNFIIYGTDATFINEFEHGRLIRSRDKEDKEYKIKENYKDIHKGELVKSFIESILNDSEAEVSLEDVFRGMSVCFAMEESAKTSRKVKVEYL